MNTGGGRHLRELYDDWCTLAETHPELSTDKIAERLNCRVETLEKAIRQIDHDKPNPALVTHMLRLHGDDLHTAGHHQLGNQMHNRADQYEQEKRVRR